MYFQTTHETLFVFIINTKLDLRNVTTSCRHHSVCFVTSCPRDGAWSSWQHWSQCSLTCGGGIQARRRSCDFPAPQNGGKMCPGVCSETKVCNAVPCTPGRLCYRVMVEVMCIFLIDNGMS